MYKQCLTVVLLVISITASAEPCTIQLETLTGTLLNKPWAKNTESYCAQGSDYFVLRIQNQDIVLSGEYSDFMPWVNKIVSVTGYRCEKEIPNPNQLGSHLGTTTPTPILQAPTGDEFRCQIFRVRNIEEFFDHRKLK